jgi:hypothetical protein
MTDKDREALQAFAQKMQQEGPAGFAAGPTPWDSWDEFEERVGSQRQTWQGKVKPVAERKAPSSSFGDRVLTTMTALAIVTLVIGIAGVFLTQQPAVQVAENNAQLPSTGPVITTEIQLPPEEDIAFNDVSIPAAPASPNTGIIMRTDMAAGPSGDQSIDQDGNPALPAIRAESDNMFTALDELPAPAAGPIYRPPETPAEPAVEAVSEEPPEFRAINMAEPEDNTPVEPIQLSKASLPDIRHTEPEQPPAQDTSEIQQGVNNGGEWSINLASYLKDSTAERMRQQFLDKGVATDLVTATVKGRTYYRLRVTGIENRDMALMQSTIIKEKLGLEETWITKK